MHYCIHSRREFDIAKAEIGIVIIVVVRPTPPLTSGCGIFFFSIFLETQREKLVWWMDSSDCGALWTLESSCSAADWIRVTDSCLDAFTKSKKLNNNNKKKKSCNSIFKFVICFVFLASQQNRCHVKCLDRELLRHTLWNDTRRFVVWEKDRTVSFTSAAIERQDRYNLVFTNWWSLIDLNSKIVKYLQIVAIKKFVESEEDPLIKKIALREIRMLKVTTQFTVTSHLG